MSHYWALFDYAINLKWYQCERCGLGKEERLKAHFEHLDKNRPLHKTDLYKELFYFNKKQTRYDTSMYYLFDDKEYSEDELNCKKVIKFISQYKKERKFESLLR